jgi:hypothetical protein
MSQYNITYHFEHKLLPELFFTQTGAFVSAAIQKKDMLYDFIDSMFRDQKEENPYSPLDFIVEPVKLDEDVLALAVMFPQPIAEPLSYAALMLFDPEFEKKRFYSIEMGNDAGDNMPFLCGWTEDGSHINYGHCSWTFSEVMERCRKMFKSE